MGKGRKPRGAPSRPWGYKYKFRDTGIFRDRVPLDGGALFEDLNHALGRDGRFVDECRASREEALRLLRKMRVQLPKDEFDEAWLNLPPLAADAFNLVLAVDELDELLSDPLMAKLCSRIGEIVFPKNEGSERIPEVERLRVARDLAWLKFFKFGAIGLTVGEFSQRLIARPHEPDARAGQKVRAGGRKGHSTRWGTEGQKRIRWAKLQTRVNAIYRQYPGRKHTWISERLEEQLANDPRVPPELKVCAKTIRRHTILPD